MIVGTSLAGLRAAEALREKGFEGRITFLGAEKHRPYDRPPLSKEILKGTWEPEKISLERGDGLSTLGLEMRLGCRATSLDTAAHRIDLEDGDSLEYDGLVIATGGTPRRIPGTPDLAGIHVLRTLDDSLAIRSELERGPRVAVVGAGFIGGEVAASCRERGLDVTMVEALSAPLETIAGTDVGTALAAAHADQGVDVRLGVGVEGFDGTDRVERLRLSDGTHVDADVVVVGIGVVPETDWLEGSGLALDDGIVCDATCAASAAGVVAAGDVASWINPLFKERMRIEHWTHATEMARAAVDSLLAGPEMAQPFESVPYFWSDQYDLKIQSIGRLPAADETCIARGSLEDRKFLKLYGRKGRLAGALGFGEARSVLALRRRMREGIGFEEARAEVAG